MELGFPLEAIIVLLGVVAVSVWLDLFSHRKSTEITFVDAASWSVFWIALAVGFYFYLKYRYGADYASLFMAGYALEKSLSIDNLMVFIAIFSSFGIKGIMQHRILYYGIIGALLFRAAFVGVGTGVFGIASWVELIFAAIVIWSAWAILKGGDDDDIEDFSDHWSVRFVKRFMPVFPRMYGKRFFLTDAEVRAEEEKDSSLTIVSRGIRYVTPALLCLVCIEVSDIIFSFDSVPAIIAVTQEPLLVYAAVIFAILGLRNLYFLLAVAAKYLCHLETAIAGVLVFIGVKLGASAIEKTWGIETFHISHEVSLYVVLGFIAIGVLASLIWPEKEDDDTPETEQA